MGTKKVGALSGRLKRAMLIIAYRDLGLKHEGRVIISTEVRNTGKRK